MSRDERAHHPTRSRADPGGMDVLTVLGPDVRPFRERKPRWFKVPPPGGPRYRNLRALITEEGLHTVCQEAACPNIGECWERGTATFMILGDTCTRRCGLPRQDGTADVERPTRAGPGRPQYLRPTERHLPVVRYWEPEEFEALAGDARALGFDHIAAGPLVRSSYHADEHVPQAHPGDGPRAVSANRDMS
jgi:lipoate synthase